MALNLCLAVPTSVYTSTMLPSQGHVSHAAPVRRQSLHTIRCAAISQTEDRTIVRRSGNYPPTIWNYDYLQSLNSEYAGDEQVKRVAQLKGNVKKMLEELVDTLEGLEMIDDLQRLGVSYHFKDEIKSILESIYKESNNDNWSNNGLHATALKFRILRQHGYNVSQEVFAKFTNEAGIFKESLSEDTKGLLYLYEASYLLVEGENILEEARDFSTKNLKKILTKSVDPYLAILVTHALDLPLHWRMIRLEARWFIDVYETRLDANPSILELGKLDFNMVQEIHQEDVKHASRWWKGSCLAEKLSFARDSLMENFLWAVGVYFEPEFSYGRRMLTRIDALLTTVDDVYDVYGTLEELELFTNALERWDVTAMEKLPEYMKICFLSVFNSVNEMAYDALTREGVDVISHLKKLWADISRSYMLEAKWYHSGYKPTLEEYVDNAWISISAPVILTHAYVFAAKPLTSEALECLVNYPNILRWSSTILRLSDDIGTSSDELKRGDNLKSIQCYMHETGASEEEAREHIKFMISETWKKMNKDRAENSPFSEIFVGIAMNLARMSQCIYHSGDGHAGKSQEFTDTIKSLLVNPLPLN